MNIIKRPPSDDKVNTLQYICSSLFTTEKLLSLNMGHLCLPLCRNGEFKELLITPKNTTVFSRKTYNKLLCEYNSLLNNKIPTKSLLDNIKSIILNDNIQPITYSYKYKEYIASRIYFNGEINIYDNYSKIVIKTELIKNILSYIDNLYIVLDILDLLHKNTPLAEEEALYMCDTYIPRHSKYLAHIKKAIETSCYNGLYTKRSFVSGYLLNTSIKFITFSDITYFNAPTLPQLPELNLEIYREFIADPYLPCVCYKDNNTQLYVLREVPGEMYDCTLQNM